MNRREARKQAFVLIFQYKFQPDDIETLLQDFFEENDAGDQKEYIEGVIKGIKEKMEEIDQLISEYSQNRSIERISSVSLAALRLGVYEIMYLDDIPATVSVNEAVAIAKEYEGEEAAPFVNGILGKIKENLG